jgi:hypothetical protein
MWVRVNIEARRTTVTIEYLSCLPRRMTGLIFALSDEFVRQKLSTQAAEVRARPRFEELGVATRTFSTRTT